MQKQLNLQLDFSDCPKTYAAQSYKGINLVYFFYDSQDSLLYVGKTNNFFHRWRQHVRKGEHDTTKVSRVELHILDSDITACFYESQMIRKLLPPWNEKVPQSPLSKIDVSPLAIFDMSDEIAKSHTIKYENESVEDIIKKLKKRSNKSALSDVARLYKDNPEVIEKIESIKAAVYKKERKYTLEFYKKIQQYIEDNKCSNSQAAQHFGITNNAFYDMRRKLLARGEIS